jgi:hypothetical protein
MKKIITIVFAIIVCTSYSQENAVNYKWGFIDDTGKEITALKYDEVKSFNYGIAAVRINSKWGGINSSGQEIIPFKYQDLGDALEMNDSLRIPVKLNDKWGLINKKDKEIVAFKYEDMDVLYFDSKLIGIAVRLSNKWGVINEIGNMIIPANFEEIDKSRDYEYLLVKINKKCGIIDFKGHETLAVIYDDVKPIGNDLFAVKTKTKWGVIKQNGEKLLPSKFSGIYEIVKDENPNIKFEAYFKRNIIFYDAAFNIVAKEKTKYGFGHFCIPFDDQLYYQCERMEKDICIKKKFDNGMGAVIKDKKWLILDVNGTPISEAIYDEIQESIWVFPAYLKVKIQNKWGIIYNDGKVIPNKYDEIGDFIDGFAPVKMFIDSRK